jgi:hypothetical protein
MNFIEKYDNVISKKECEYLINLFDFCPFQVEGRAGGKIDHEKKLGVSVDLFFKSDSENTVTEGNQIINEIILPSIVECLNQYKKKYPLMEKLTSWNIDNDYHIQRFKENQGYYATHCEQQGPTSKRMLVWMFYLNDAKSGTRFYHQKVDMKAKSGRVVIWPAGWTHMHSGIIPNKGDKYIVTGWFSYD